MRQKRSPGLGLSAIGDEPARGVGVAPTMTDNPYKDDLSRFAVTFTRSVIAWNNAENAARRILEDFGGSGLGVRVVAAHLTSNALRDALRTLCDLFSDPQLPHSSALSGHVAHFTDGFDILRNYRNFYVHSLLGLGQKPDDPAIFRGYLHAIEARGRMAYVEQYVETAELESFMGHTLELKEYGSQIRDAIPADPRSALAVFREAVPVSALSKPIWPEKLAKNRTYSGQMT